MKTLNAHSFKPRKKVKTVFFSSLCLILFPGFIPSSKVETHKMEQGEIIHGSDISEDLSRVIKRSAKNTVTPVLLNRGDVLEFTLNNGQKRSLKLLETNAAIMRTNHKGFENLQNNGGTIAQFTCKILIDGHVMVMQRYLPTQESFYEPYVINGMRIWFDAVQDYFDFFTLKHGWCKPRAHARFAVSDANDPVAPNLAMWYPNDELYINVKDCYLGDDVWMGPYLGGSPHAGLDINTPKGTPLFAPIDFDNQWLDVDFMPKPYYWAATMKGLKQWNNGSIWTLTTLHLDKYLVSNNTPLKKEKQFGVAAGTGVGVNEHSHFEFMIQDDSINTVDDKVMVRGDILVTRGSSESKKSSTNYLIDVNGIIGQVPKSSALYIRRSDRPKNRSVFMIEEELAIKNNFKYEIPQIPLDPWILFWQMFENEKDNKHLIKAHIESLSPARTGETVTFNSVGSFSQTGQKELTYYWTFGDGGFSNVENPKYVFAKPGIYPISLVVEDSEGNRDKFVQHVTVDGNGVESPALSLRAEREPSFVKRNPSVMDVYGENINTIPHTLYSIASPKCLKPEKREITLVNLGGGSLEKVSVDIIYEKNMDWLQVVNDNKSTGQNLLVSTNAKGLSPGNYRATVKIKSPGALNSPQTFLVSFDVLSQIPDRKEVVIDNLDSGFFATPYFWVGGLFHRWKAGYKNFYLTNGGRAKKGEYFRFTPILRKGKYKVSFTSETPFEDDSRFKVWVHDSHGDNFIWMQPNQSLQIGVFDFSEGSDGFVQIFAESSEGEVLADAVRFEKVDD